LQDAQEIEDGKERRDEHHRGQNDECEDHSFPRIEAEPLLDGRHVNERTKDKLRPLEGEGQELLGCHPNPVERLPHRRHFEDQQGQAYLEQEARDERAQTDRPNIHGANERYAEEADDAKRRLSATAE
jgi:hypothetical protein